MNARVSKQKSVVFILVAVLMVTFGTENIIYAQEVTPSITATVVEALSETNLDGKAVTITLSNGTFESSIFDIRGSVSVSGIAGITIPWHDPDRESDTELTLELEYDGTDFDETATLTFTLVVDAIVGYEGAALTAQLPVTAVEESMTATTEAPLTEAALHGSVVTLTLSGRAFNSSRFTIERAISMSGIDGVSIATFGVDRVSSTEVTIELEFTGDIDADGTLTITVGADAISGYNQGFSFDFNVTAVEESMTAAVATPLTEATLYGNVVTLTLSGRAFDSSRFDIERAISMSGIDGVSIPTFGVDRVSSTEVTIELEFTGDIDADDTLTITVGADAINGYNQGFSFDFNVTAVEESMEIVSSFSLNEASLNDSIITLQLNGRSFEDSRSIMQDNTTVEGIEGVAFNLYLPDGISIFSDRYVFGNRLQIIMRYDGTDFDTDQTLTITVGADAIAGYGESFAVDIPVTAIKQSAGTISISPDSITSPPLGEQMTVDINIAGGINVAGFQANVDYDSSALRYIRMTDGDYLPADSRYLDPVGKELFNRFVGEVPIAAIALNGVGNGNGTLATLTFDVVDVTNSLITLSDVYIVDRDGVRWEVVVNGSMVKEPPHDIVGDINRDGIVNIQDLILVSNLFGTRGEHRADVNNDGIIDIVDLVITANAIGARPASPTLIPQTLELLTASDVKGWLLQAQQLDLSNSTYMGGVQVLEQLLNVLTPKNTLLLPNFPNPFNPETWIPYQLAKSADVWITIYDIRGRVVRSLHLGHQAAGIYENRSRAAYWDGRNAHGEPVASGVYFYVLRAGSFTATRKMTIRK